jgi:TorA maturation chaperone TorD
MTQKTRLSDRDLTLVRLRFIDLLKSFFQHEPDAEMMSRWRGIFAALVKERINPELDAAVQGINTILATGNLQNIQNEYYALFTDPYSKHLLPLNASYYLDGNSFGPSLVSYRELLKTAQLVKHEGISEPEDSLVLMLDALASLIDEKKQDDTQPQNLQEELVLHFLIPTAEKLAAAVKNNPEADFYQYCIGFLCGYLELEEGISCEAEYSS